MRRGCSVKGAQRRSEPLTGRTRRFTLHERGAGGYLCDETDSRRYFCCDRNYRTGGCGIIVCMAVADYYDPEPPAECPACQASVPRWQGYGGPGLMLLWRQHHRHPIGDLSDEGWRLPPDRYGEFSLPDEFEISASCPNGHSLRAQCKCVDSVWAEIDLSAEERFYEDKARRERLRRWHGE